MNLDTQTYSWALTLRGIAAILFGVAAVFWPGITLLTVLYLFGAWIVVDGVIRVVTGINRLDKGQFGFLTLVIGVLQLGVGVYLLRHPHISLKTLIFVFGFTLVAVGVVEAVSTLGSAHSSAVAKTLTLITSVAMLVAGVVMLFQPVASGVAFVWILGLFALIEGPLLIAVSLDVQKVGLPDGKRR